VTVITDCEQVVWLKTVYNIECQLMLVDSKCMYMKRT